ncbi:unnamed protein product, partial [Mesorhabditis belari]|uniref:Uncharacterized protein n=1 Tax=Mesorhabditis belari TaxID=2138241 RepID=A0AAF3F4Y7_9BILA
MSGETSNLAFTHILGQGRVNQLGGVFINGRPLPQHIRAKIVEMAASGVKPCQISRQLRVSHGAVSKILNRYAETGSICPGQIGGNPRSRLPVQAVERQILDVHDSHPDLTPVEVREKLVEIGICARSTAPSVSSISRLLRSVRSSAQSPTVSEPPSAATTKKRLSHSIDSILGLSSEDDTKSYTSTSTSSSDDDSTLSPSEPRRNRTSFSSAQLEVLETAFRKNTYPDAAERETLSQQANLTEEKIMTWFSNRRARCRKSIPLNLAAVATGLLPPPPTHLQQSATGFPFPTPSLSFLLPPQLMFPQFVGLNHG